ncbi:fragment of glycoside hydrolase family 2 protein [Candidatus Sulfotelmatomonas gaucii]|uniref:Fragment of glycoside hydrolase family 2 protein n=1 Tax=Candidatus Sulfuritelmatomonas gaucii TaxID=2043161 RepID=A0A2N9L3D8_9BACT|nr:fragment of glycoside hydrolase family 2 protein [Candidatus Sulfotelmatomonas gaucii]
MAFSEGMGWWSFCDARPWLAGGFVWTGFDYRGEPSPYQWPNISSQYGIIDTCGFPKRGRPLGLRRMGRIRQSAIDVAYHRPFRWSCIAFNGEAVLWVAEGDANAPPHAAL